MKPIEQTYWDDFLASVPADKRPAKPFVTAAYAGSPEITDALLALYLAGKKTAGSSIAEDFESAGDPLPKVGNFWIYLDSKGVPSCILRTERIEIHKFMDVPVSVAIAEGEGDLSIGNWRKIHSEIYSPSLRSWGLECIEDATVITEHFKMVYR